MRPKPDQRFAIDTYLLVKSLWKGTPARHRHRSGRGVEHASLPFSAGRDPLRLDDLLAVATEDMGWTSEIEQARVIADWPVFIGSRTAAHTQVVELRDGVLVIQCDSTAWATELRRMRAHIMSRIIEEYPQAEIEDLRFLAPGAPRWRYGSRVVQGRGPRDTYG